MSAEEEGKAREERSARETSGSPENLHAAGERCQSARANVSREF
jgi:hypothetical protein